MATNGNGNGNGDAGYGQGYLNGDYLPQSASAHYDQSGAGVYDDPYHPPKFMQAYESEVAQRQAQEQAQTENEIIVACQELCHFLIKKNRAYGNSALDPMRIFSSASDIEQIDVRIDDKLSRIRNKTRIPGDDDVKDLAGYLVLRMIKERRGQ